VRLQSAGKGSGTSAWRVLKEAMDHGVRWHSLRPLFAVRCLQRGIPIAVVSQWMGHSDVNLTVKRYGRFAAEAKEQFAWINALGQPVEALAEARQPRLEVAR
jgi:integrase